MNNKSPGVAPTTDSGDEYAPADQTFTDDMQGTVNLADRIATSEQQVGGEPGDQPAPDGPVQFVAPEDLPERKPGEGQQ
jgi:hypothetical protein